MSKTNSYPDFHKPAEGQPPLTTEQLTETNKAFNGLFDDLMLQGMGDVTRSELTEDGPTADLLRKIEVDGQQYVLGLVDRSPEDPNSEIIGITFRDSEVITREIRLQRIDEGHGREYWRYHLGADGIVRRFDSGDLTAKSRKDRELGIEGLKIPSLDATPEEYGKFALAGLRRLTNTIPNHRLEEDMGLNNQPVMPDEIQGLQGFLARATDIPG